MARQFIEVPEDEIIDQLEIPNQISPESVTIDRTKLAKLSESQVPEEKASLLYNSLKVDYDLLAPENGTYNTKFTPEQKVLSIVWYAITGNVHEVARRCNISRQVFYSWKAKPWFAIILDQIRKVRNDMLDAKLSQIMEDGADELHDRVRNGDYTLTKEGDIIRIPMKSRDLALAGLQVPMTQRMALRGEDRTKIERQTIDKVLNSLVDQFVKISQKTRPTEVIEADYKEIPKESDEKSS